MQGFDSKKYIKAQTKAIKDRIKKYEKFYLEFGGKLVYDYHASRVLPGYDPTNKIKILKTLKNRDIIYCVNAKNIQKKKVLGDFNLTHDEQTLKDIKDLKSFGIKVNFVVITLYKNQKLTQFIRKLKKQRVKVIIHREIKGYPNNISLILKGYEQQPYIPTKNKLVIITGPAGGSGKMATALIQINHERKNNIKSSFAKFETFPIWNLKRDHPVNIAYEAATADLNDKNKIDTYHKKAYGITAVNYNRDIFNFKILKRIMTSSDNFSYKSPTDMGLNMAKVGIINDKICREAAKQEIIRRYFVYYKEFKQGKETIDTLNRMKQILRKI
ncbi:DUF1846 family protein [Candidatus Woesearchaeota archaeon]|nr:DUF1846 family protein [Candidatus Woesearchaeota archaeon]